MATVKLVNAYIGSTPFKPKHLNGAQFLALGQRLKDCVKPENMVTFEDDRWEDLFFHGVAAQPGIRPATREVPSDRFSDPMQMVYSNIILLNRFYWVYKAYKMFPKTDQFAWLEYSVFKQRNVNEGYVHKFIRDIEEYPLNVISLPGCWPKAPVDDGVSNWRAVGSCWVCPRELVEPLWTVMKTIIGLRIGMTNTISLDNNTWAYVDLLDVLPIRWYPANHDETQMSNYLHGLV